MKQYNVVSTPSYKMALSMRPPKDRLKTVFKERNLSDGELIQEDRRYFEKH